MRPPSPSDDYMNEDPPSQYATGSTGETKDQKKEKVVVVVDDAHPFDLDAYIASYADRTAIQRLQFIAQSCPGLASSALEVALEQIQRSRDTSTYLRVLTLYNALPTTAIATEGNKKWLEETQARNATERDKLEVELKTYTSNMIKESIRMGHRELGHYHRGVGDHATALKNYSKSREFCTTSSHVLEMCLSVLELLIEQQNYPHISTYVFKADAALDVAAPTSGSVTDKATPAAPSKKTANPEREKVQTKLDFATALAHLGQCTYEKAAYGFIKLSRGLDDWVGKIVAPSDIAIYGTLCALASLSRSAIKASVVESDTFGYYLEHEPYIRELIDAYMSSKFKTVLELLERHKARHLLDIHLAPHVPALMSMIRNRALVLYFQPFASIRLEKMAQAFGLGLEETEKQIVSLIQEGQIKGRVDSQNKILKAKDLDHRTELYARAIKMGTDMESTNRKLLLRMRLVQADLIVKNPKQQQQQAQLEGAFLGYPD